MTSIRSLMTRRQLGLAALSAAGLAGLPAGAWAQSKTLSVLSVGVVSLEGDPRYRPRRTEKAYPGHPTNAAIEGVKLGIADSLYELEAAGLQVSVRESRLSSADEVGTLLDSLREQPARIFFLDLPADLLAAFSKAAPARLGTCILLNTSQDSDDLRGSSCAAHLLHTAPSRAMLADALAQYLAAQNWRSVLMLTGPSPADQLQRAASLRAAKRFGLKAVEERPFKLTGDPSERDLGNTRLLTTNRKADVIWVHDSDGEFARTLPYATQQPRPVVGSSGLSPLAWHPQHDRYGALQLSRRFLRQTGRPMVGQDWSAWIAARAVCAALLDRPKGSVAELLARLRSGAITLDGFKGRQLSFRPWDGQLRQPVMLSHGDGVVAFAPVEGVLHPTEVLDTLGPEAKESACR